MGVTVPKVQDRMAYNHLVVKVSKFVLVDVFSTTAHLSTHLRSSDMITSMRVFQIFFPYLYFLLDSFQRHICFLSNCLTLFSRGICMYKKSTHIFECAILILISANFLFGKKYYM